uniref:Uncharacterized protein n=1 Tax=Arundo donax TaxID=35708 RepID=A0A0A8ZD78_ARUDO
MLVSSCWWRISLLQGSIRIVKMAFGKTVCGILPLESLLEKEEC